jgi:hypothetical protein
MLNKRDVCAEIGNFFGTFYEDISGFLVIDDGETDHLYSSEDELLKDWLPTLIEADEETGDDYWYDIIEYIQNYIIED